MREPMKVLLPAVDRAAIADAFADAQRLVVVSFCAAWCDTCNEFRAGYERLGLHTYFTAGPKEVRAWTISHGATASQAAGVIHTDFEKGFIRAEVIAFTDYQACNGEQGAKEAGKMRLEGRDYVVRDGDVMHFRFNV